MERTQLAYGGGDLSAQVRAEQQRISEAPDELVDEYRYFGEEGGVPNGVIERIQDWVQEHCGFVPRF